MQLQYNKSKSSPTEEVKSRMNLQPQQDFGRMVASPKQLSLLRKLSSKELNEAITRGLMQAEQNALSLLRNRKVQLDKNLKKA